MAATFGGHLALDLVAFGILAACSLALVLLGRRSETYQGLTDKAPDERFARIGGRAWAGTVVVLTVGNLCAFIGELASGRSGDRTSGSWPSPPSPTSASSPSGPGMPDA